MGGQVLGGGVIVLVAVALWALYLIPSWHSRHLFNSAERNAVRLNQALRVLAETSETPDEVRLELNARTAAAQQKLAKQSLAEQERAGLATAKAELEQSKLAAVAEIEAARQAARAAKAEAARQRAVGRMQRVRRRARFVATLVGLAALGAVGAGIWLTATGATSLVLWVGSASLVTSILVLQQMHRVAARAVVRTPVSVVTSARETEQVVQDVVLAAPVRAAWQPRTLPAPLSSSAGSAAARTRDAADAREALRKAAIDEAKRERAAQAAPPTIESVRAEPAASAFSRMGYVDDAEIEAHVRSMLGARAAS